MNTPFDITREKGACGIVVPLGSETVFVSRRILDDLDWGNPIGTEQPQAHALVANELAVIENGRLVSTALFRIRWNATPPLPTRSPVKRLAESIWDSIDDSGIKGRLHREDCDYLARLVLDSGIVKVAS